MTGDSLLVRPIRAIGRGWMTGAEHAGQMGLLLWGTATTTARLRIPLRVFANQLYVMGVQSIPIVVVTSVLSGIVTSQQGGYQITATVPLYVLGSVTAKSIALELAPVLSAIVLVGRVGARITAELGTMVVSEQMDAYRSLGRDPLIVLGAPRILAGLVVMPLLVGIANIVGLISGMVCSQIALGLSFETFLFGARLFWYSWDLFYSFLKSVAFGLAIPLIAIHMGLRAGGGAEGVGRITTASVMFQTLTILTVDAMFPALFLD